MRSLGRRCAPRKNPSELVALSEKLAQMLDDQLDADGMHLSRNPHSQIQLLSELIPVNQALNARHPEARGGDRAQGRGHAPCADRLLLGTREIAYINGCGQLPVDLVLAISAQSGARSIGSGLSGGYGVLMDGRGKVVADCGRVPPLGFADNAHAGALSFEFSCGRNVDRGQLRTCTKPTARKRAIFRHSAAHSAPTIDDVSSARLGGCGLAGQLLRLRGSRPGSQSISARTMRSRWRHRGLSPALRARSRAPADADGGRADAGGPGSVYRRGPRKPRAGRLFIRFHLAPGRGGRTR